MFQDHRASSRSEDFHTALYGGAIVRFRELGAMRELVDFTREFVEQRLHPHPPVEIHRCRPKDEVAEKLAAIQRDFSRCGEVKRLWREVFEAAGLDLTATARDRLVLRFQLPVDPERPPLWSRNTATASFHRDSWGTNLYAQINWWAPVYPITEGRTVALFPQLWSKPLANSSAEFDMAEVMRRVREEPASLTPGDLIPRLLEPVDFATARPVVIGPGSVIAFSSQHAHAGVPNHTGFTRLSLETRTLQIADYLARRGAPNVDGSARWVALGLFRRISDNTPLPEVLGTEALMPFQN